MNSDSPFRWIDSESIPSLRIKDKIFYVEAVMREGLPNLSASHVYSPLHVAGANVYVREVSEGLKMVVLAEYAREARSTLSINPWRKAR